MCGKSSAYLPGRDVGFDEADGVGEQRRKEASHDVSHEPDTMSEGLLRLLVPYRDHGGQARGN